MRKWNPIKADFDIAGAATAATPSAVDGVISVGTVGGAISNVLSVLSPQSIGSRDTSLSLSSTATTAPAGTAGLSLASSNDVGVETISVGTRGTSMTQLDTGSETISVGSRATVMDASSIIVGTKYTGTATAVSNGGTVDWVNPTDAQGIFNDTNATITVTAASGTINDDLKLTAFSIPAIPSGFTRTKLELLIRHLWDSTGAVLETCSFVVAVRKADNTLVSNVRTITQATASQATLVTETFDFTTAGAGLTDAEVQGLQVWCEADAALLVVLQGNFSWSVDGVYLRVTYTKSGIT